MPVDPASLAVLTIIAIPSLYPVTQQLFFPIWGGKVRACDYGIQFDTLVVILHVQRKHFYLLKNHNQPWE